VLFDLYGSASSTLLDTQDGGWLFSSYRHRITSTLVFRHSPCPSCPGSSRGISFGPGFFSFRLFVPSSPRPPRQFGRVSPLRAEPFRPAFFKCPRLLPLPSLPFLVGCDVSEFLPLKGGWKSYPPFLLLKGCRVLQFWFLHAGYFLPPFLGWFQLWFFLVEGFGSFPPQSVFPPVLGEAWGYATGALFSRPGFVCSSFLTAGFSP